MRNRKDLRIDSERLQSRITVLGQVGALPGGGVRRLAFTDEDKEARDLLARWMNDLGLELRVDNLGNMFGWRHGRRDLPPVMVGSHLDTVGTGGLYDGSLGVLAGLEIAAALNDYRIETERPYVVANFSNEEGVRFTPDMMGSLAFSRQEEPDHLLNAAAVDGSGRSVREELVRIGYAGKEQCGSFPVHAFFELHIEQGPVLETEGLDIGAVEMVQGIFWTEYRFAGTANHAGTTPMHLRRDAGLLAASVAPLVRHLVYQAGDSQVGTVGLVELSPNLINVVAERARVIVDLRNTDLKKLQAAQEELDVRIEALARGEQVEWERSELVRFAPVRFAPALVEQIADSARRLGYSSKKMPSGAGHDAQMMAAVCPAAMIFVPSENGISHNIREFTPPAAVEKGGNVLLQVAMSRLLA